ncbi:hypothetical protein ABW21_db0207694 [Orbilia brochopaga]|nr:hypothetical protein ABW21_db0207694 [Drechslerella brochopaga]
MASMGESTTPVTSAAPNGGKVKKNTKPTPPLPSSPQGSVPGAVAEPQVLPGELVQERGKYHFSSIHALVTERSSGLGGNDTVSRPRSSGGSGVQTAEEYRARSSQNSDKGSGRVSSHLFPPVERFGQGAPAAGTTNVIRYSTPPPPSEDNIENGARNRLTPDATVGESSKAGESAAKGESSQGPDASAFLKPGKNSATTSADQQNQPQGPHSPQAEMSMSAPKSAKAGSRRYVAGTDPPVDADGKDARNFATWRRDVQREFENRRLEGRHEHPLEGSTALHQKTNIQSIGLTQLVTSTTKTVKKLSKGFKTHILRQAHAVPATVNTIAHGHIPHPEKVPTQKALTRSQRMAEYRAITEPVLLTYGPRVKTPPPIPRPVSDDDLGLPVKKNIMMVPQPKEVLAITQGSAENVKPTSTATGAVVPTDGTSDVVKASSNDAQVPAVVKPKQRQRYRSLLEGVPYPPATAAKGKGPATQKNNTAGTSHGFVEKNSKKL